MCTNIISSPFIFLDQVHALSGKMKERKKSSLKFSLNEKSRRRNEIAFNLMEFYKKNFLSSLFI